MASASGKNVKMSGERKLRKLTQEGYIHRFVDNVDEYNCTFCILVARDATQISSCGHSFCGSCWNDWVSSSTGTVHCPIDDEAVQPDQVFKDRKQDRAIRGLKVYCENQEFGCDATPELRDLETHLEKCQYKPVPCELGCDEQVFVWSMAEHLQNACPRRVLVCGDCGEKMVASDVPTHIDQCPMKLVTCEFCKWGGIHNKDLTAHQKTECLHFPTYCSFAVVGCTDMVDRSELPNHHQTAALHHLSLMNSAVCLINDNVGATHSFTDCPLVHCPYELPSALWGRLSRMGRVESLGSIRWDELPKSEGESNDQMTVCKMIQLLRTENCGLKEKLGRLEKNNEILKAQIDNEAGVNAQQSLDITALRNDADYFQLMDEIHRNAVANKIDDIEHKNDVAITELKEFNTARRYEIVELTESSNLVSATNEELRNEVANLKQRGELLVTDVKDVKLQINEIDALKQLHEQEITALKKTNKEHENEIAALKEQNEEQFAQMNRTFRNEIAAIKQTNTEEIQAIKISHKKQAKELAVIKLHEKEIKDIFSENEKAISQNEILLKLSECLKKKVDTLEKEMVDMKQQKEAENVSLYGAEGGAVGGAVSQYGPGETTKVQFMEMKDGVRNVCPAFWRITVKNLMKEWSPEFYTESGYKMRIQVQCHGLWFHVYGHIVKGERDGCLKWPWVGKETMTVRKAGTDKLLVGDCGAPGVTKYSRDRPKGDMNDSPLFLNTKIGFGSGFTQLTGSLKVDIIVC